MFATWKATRASTSRSGSHAARRISSVNFPPKQIASIDAGVPIKVLTGLHSAASNCSPTESIRSITDLKGKRVGVDGFNNSRHVWLTLMAAYVGLDPVKDIHWVID